MVPQISEITAPRVNPRKFSGTIDSSAHIGVAVMKLEFRQQALALPPLFRD
jgi:hypothetical protein